MFGAQLICLRHRHNQLIQANNFYFYIRLAPGHNKSLFTRDGLKFQKCMLGRHHLPLIMGVKSEVRFAFSIYARK
jgi:hypothetical protein